VSDPKVPHSGARELSSLILPDQPNQSPPRDLSAALSATASPPAVCAAEDDAKGTRFDTTTSLPFDPPGTIAAGLYDGSRRFISEMTLFLTKAETVNA
jgi:hypothetical protein